ncbi:hypothetical protein BDZ89DRAFT_1139565 [Hymenopellis radicata]|nr:hypothetical protein BDZ89DRAFT_1139565 [Hymenopellis radicata]
MAHSPQAPHGNVSSGPSPRTGRNSLLFMGAVALGFAGFYYAIDRRDRLRRESASLLPVSLILLLYPPHIPYAFIDERALLRAKEDHGGHRLYASDAPSDHVVKPPVHTHDPHHFTLDSEHAGPAQSVPSPQRSKGDGSGLAYTKSPDFVRSYGKTKTHRDDPTVWRRHRNR